MKKFLLSVSGIYLLNFSGLFAQNFYSIDTIQKIEVQFSQSNWDYILDTAKQGSDSYTMAQWIKINGVLFDSAGIKYKGNSSYNPNNAKNPLHIELDHFKNQDYLGYKDIKLSNGYNEPSFVREVLAYNMLQNYMEAPIANFAQVYINGLYFGLYTNVEAITKTFVNDRFFSDTYPFFFMDNGGCDLRYKGPDSTLYYSPYTIKSDYGWGDLVSLCGTLKNNINGIENVLDVDRNLWMLAFTNATVTLDSYLGNSKHNYYIYEDHNGRFNPIAWDMNGAFGIFNKVDTGAGLSVSQMQTLPPLLHSNDSMWPLVKNIFAVPRYRKIYLAHMRTIVNENFSDSSYINDALYLQSIIDTAVQSDTKKFFSYGQFISNINTNVISGPKTIPGITFLMNARNSYLNSTSEFQQVPPVISNIQPSDNFPLLNSNIFITADISNANAVYLGMRNSVMERFNRIQMYDDGLHGDGSLGDGIFGVSVSVISPEMHYYIYAENTNAGIFSPERAEHNWYTLISDYSTINSGEIVINEIMALNNSTVQNGNGLYGDWIELYNTTPDTISLDNLNLSDDVTNPVKWKFPAGTKILPNGFLIVWVDADTVSGELHCDFKFSGSGESAMLSYANGNVIDSIDFPAQSADISWGRYPNGTGPFVIMPPTFNGNNSSFSGMEGFSVLNNRIYIFPNPNNGVFSIYSFLHEQGDLSGEIEIEISDVLGNVVFHSFTSQGKIDLSGILESGIYFLKPGVNNFFQTKKIIIQK